jgi:phosphoribosyl-ATP pyrophosphohydrolase/phosphoribosyl-AMP cyclohydrolase
MLGYMNKEALERTYESGKVTFYSRSRNELWTKGETSGNYLLFDHAKLDCDGDAILIQASPTGPTCHQNTTTCWGDSKTSPIAFIDELRSVIRQRNEERPSGFYLT